MTRRTRIRLDNIGRYILAVSVSYLAAAALHGDVLTFLGFSMIGCVVVWAVFVESEMS